MRTVGSMKHTIRFNFGEYRLEGEYIPATFGTRDYPGDPAEFSLLDGWRVDDENGLWRLGGHELDALLDENYDALMEVACEQARRDDEGAEDDAVDAAIERAKGL